MVMDVDRLEGEVISLYGAGGVCEAMKTGLLLAGLRINFNQRASLAGFVTPCVTVWDRSGSITLQPQYNFVCDALGKIIHHSRFFSSLLRYGLERPVIIRI